MQTKLTFKDEFAKTFFFASSLIYNGIQTEEAGNQITVFCTDPFIASILKKDIKRGIKTGAITKAE